MPVYIQSAEAISPQDTFRLEKLHKSSFSPAEPLSEKGYYISLHPQYKEYINPSALRRMSPVIRMGLAASKICMAEAGIETPDAILVGTGLGCVRDTAKFLNQIIDNGEQLLNPTAFIQSTHNTVSGQIALMLGCRKYNLTFSHNSISFESALLDGMLLLDDGEAHNILLGGIDETVDESFQLMQKSGCLKGPAGEGSNFFVLSSHSSERSMARVDGVEILNHCEDSGEITRQTHAFLASKGLDVSGVDLFVSGRNGDVRYHDLYSQQEQLFDPAKVVRYKHLVGEYDTATGFATWLASRIIKDNVIPDVFASRISMPERGPIRRVLLFNQNKGRDFSWILLSQPDT
jgi:Beta-ketoacyl synthase, N-terminal domain